MVPTVCLFYLGGLLISIGMVFGMRLSEMTLGLRESLDECHAERVRIARDLHDTVLQSAQALLFRLQLWTCDTSIPEERRAEMSVVVMQARASVVECRDRLRGLRRGDGERVDLVTALGTVGAAESDGQGVCFKVNCDGERRLLRSEAYDRLLDIGREAIRNALRHARASHIQVTVEFRKGSLRLQVADDGCGIEASLLQCQQYADHFGLIGMRERATQLGAPLLIDTNRGTGTRIQLTVAGRVAFLNEKARAWRLVRLKIMGC